MHFPGGDLKTHQFHGLYSGATVSQSTLEKSHHTGRTGLVPTVGVRVSRWQSWHIGSLPCIVLATQPERARSVPPCTQYTGP